MRDTYLLFRNQLLFTARNPLWIFFGLFQPIVYLLLFAPFLKSIASAPGFPAGNAIQFFAPGLLIMTAMFGAGFAGFALLDKLASGFIERVRVTPVSRIAIALGFVCVNAVTLLVQSIILVLVATILGLTVSWSGALLLALLILFIGVMMASVSYALALLLKDGGTLAATTNFFTLPLLLLSGVMLPLAFAPKILQNIATIDPFRYAVDAARLLMSGVINDHSVYLAFAVFIVLAVLALRWFIRVMREAVA